MTNATHINFLIRIKNASLASQKTMSIRTSKYCVNIAKILKDNHFINDYSQDKTNKMLFLNLATDVNPLRISQVKILSKPGCRLYQNNASIPWGVSSQSLIIISTSSGLMSHKEAKKKGLGGELIAEIY